MRKNFTFKDLENKLRSQENQSFISYFVACMKKLSAKRNGAVCKEFREEKLKKQILAAFIKQYLKEKLALAGDRG